MGRWTRGRSAGGGYAGHRCVRGALGQLLGYAARCTQPIHRLTAWFPTTAGAGRYPILNTSGVGCLYSGGGHPVGNDPLRVCGDRVAPWLPVLALPRMFRIMLRAATDPRVQRVARPKVRTFVPSGKAVLVIVS